jgi:lipopolysaccharide export system permease protein
MKKSIFIKFLRDTFKMFMIMALSVSAIVWVVQAVNYLDFVSEDGHGLLVYFKYTALNFPKIINRIIPFAFMISLFYQVLEYEKKNELLIFWINGITKKQFINVIVTYSFLITLFQVFLSAYVSPLSQHQAKQFIANSSNDFFPSLIKEGKFIDAIVDLTIFIESKDSDGNFKNIFLSNNFNLANKKKMLKKSEIIFAKNGILINGEKNRYFELLDGKIIRNDGSKIQEFTFEKIKYDLTEYTSSTNKFPKIQEAPSLFLIKCVYYKFTNKLKNVQDIRLGSKNYGCTEGGFKIILEEFLKRLFKPFYILLLGLIVSLLILRSKDQINYNRNKNFIFATSFFLIVISELSLRYSAQSITGTLFFIFFPLLIFITVYLFIYRKFGIS